MNEKMKSKDRMARMSSGAEMGEWQMSASKWIRYGHEICSFAERERNMMERHRK